MTGEKEKIKKDDFQKALASYTQAMRAFHKGDFEKAFDLLKVFIVKYPLEKELLDRAKMYKDICKARKQKTSFPLKTFDDKFQYGVYKTNQGQHEEALSVMEKALKMDPGSGKALYLISNIFYSIENIDESMFYLKKAVEADDYYKMLAQNDAIYENLKEDERFKEIVEQK